MLDLWIVTGRALGLARRGHRELVFENLTLRNQLTAMKRATGRPPPSPRPPVLNGARAYLGGIDLSLLACLHCSAARPHQPDMRISRRFGTALVTAAQMTWRRAARTRKAFRNPSASAKAAEFVHLSPVRKKGKKRATPLETVGTFRAKREESGPNSRNFAGSDPPVARGAFREPTAARN
jgi:hypothetical protein